MKKIEAFIILGIVFLLIFPFCVTYLVLALIAELIIVIKEMFFDDTTEYLHSIISSEIKSLVEKFRVQYYKFIEE